MHGHMAFFGAYVMIVLGDDHLRAAGLTGTAEESRETAAGLWAFWLQVGGHVRDDDGVRRGRASRRPTWSGSSGIGYLETQLKIQVHFLMLRGDRRCSSSPGVALFLWDFFFLAPARPRGAPRRARPSARGARRRSERRSMTVQPAPSAAAIRGDGVRRPGARSRSTSRSATRWRSSRPATPSGLPVMLKGPTGCGKTRFVEHMAWRLGGRW